ncbi:MAG TPA: hypothetical protein VMW24_27995 [Sedimentisphaerales bacterium]|nr:hypothetical protein [Sedimentisphaerales bacterium]
MSNLLIKIGFWIAAKGLNDLSEDNLTVDNAEATRDVIMGFIMRRYQKAVASKKITADERFWWFWARVLKSNRLTTLYEAKKNDG